MAIVNPMGNVYETLLSTLATTAVFPTSEAIVEVDVHARLPKTASKRTTKPLVEEELHRVLALLTQRERAVITLRYGIGDGRSRTLLEVGKELGISRERVRQLEAVALKKIRSHVGY